MQGTQNLVSSAEDPGSQEVKKNSCDYLFWDHVGNQRLLSLGSTRIFKQQHKIQPVNQSHVSCFPAEGLSGAGAAAEGREDRAASDGAADAGDGEGSLVTGRGEAGGHPAAAPAAQRPGQSRVQHRLSARLALNTPKHAPLTVTLFTLPTLFKML